MKEVKVSELPKCDYCNLKARYDAKTNEGYWSNMCLFHWMTNSAYPSLGMGKGQKLTLDKQK